jgi:hypothetical protein
MLATAVYGSAMPIAFELVILSEIVAFASRLLVPLRFQQLSAGPILDELQLNELPVVETCIHDTFEKN